MSFPYSMNTVPEHTGPLPDEVDVVVIGGGIVGVMSAYFLNQRGLRAVVLEKGRIAGEQSGRNWGWVRQQGRDPAELPIMIEANRIWKDLAQKCDRDIGLRWNGVLYLADKPEEVGRYEDWMVHAREHGVDTQILTKAAVAEKVSGASRDWNAGLWTASDGRAEPWVALPSIARHAASTGVIIRENCAVRSMDVEGGRVAGVVTEAGRIRAPKVLLAGGAWSSLFARAHGVDLPQLSVRATVTATRKMPEAFTGGAAAKGFAFWRRADGCYGMAQSDFHDVYIGPDTFRHFGRFVRHLSEGGFGNTYRPMSPKGFPDGWGTPRHWSADQETPFERQRMLNPAPSTRRVRQMARDFGKLYPQLGPVEIRSSWAGMIDTMPDVVPVIDNAPSLPGLTIATGMSGHGFGIGPGVGRVVADLIAENDIGHDLSRFRIGRFTDGSRLEVGPGL